MDGVVPGRRLPLSHHVRSPAVALLADEIADQADADLQAALKSSFMDATSDSNAVPAKFVAQDASALGASAFGFQGSSRSRDSFGSTPRLTTTQTFAAAMPNKLKTASPRSFKTAGSRGPRTEVHQHMALRKQYRGSPRAPRAAAASMEEVVKINGGRLNVQREVSHTVTSSEEAGAALSASRPMPAIDDFAALRAELAQVSCSSFCASVRSSVTASWNGMCAGRWRRLTKS